MWRKRSEEGIANKRIKERNKEMTLRVRRIHSSSLQVRRAQIVSEFSGLAASVVRSPLELRVVTRSAISRSLAPLTTFGAVGVIGDLTFAACW